MKYGHPTHGHHGHYGNPNHHGFSPSFTLKL